jgi:hypothetical protein
MTRLCPRLILLLLPIAGALSGAAVAAVTEPTEGLTIEHGRAAERRGPETLHPLQVDRRPFEAKRGLELPGTRGRTLHARFERSTSAHGDFTWIGKVQTGLGEQAAVITFGRDATFGTIPQPDGPPLRIETRHGRPWLVEGELPHRMRSGSRNDARIPAASGDTGSGTAPPSAAATTSSIGSAPVVDVLVVYTPSLVSRYGSASAALSRLTYLENLTNQAYVDSGANIRIRVVARNLLNYTTASSNDTLLNLITDPSSSPVKAQVDTWRAQTGADLVAAVRAFASASMDDCGQGWIGGYHGSSFDPRYGFSALGDGADGGYYCTDQTFAHELGHNMGLHHDYETANGDSGAYSYSRGYRKTLSATDGFATVMAYTDGPQHNVNLFSNPALVACEGQPCGVSGSSEAARSLTNTAARVAAMVGTVVAPPPAITLSVGDASVAEGNSGTTTVSFVVTASAASSSAISFNAATTDGTATAGSDYVALAPGPVLLAAGSTSRTVSVTVNGDTAVEPNETFNLVLSNPSGATLADDTGTATITNDDVALPPPTLSIGDVSVTEGNSGTKTMTFPLTLSRALATAVTYDVATANSKALAGSDYVARALTGQSIPAGATTGTFAVTINGDTTPESNEGLYVHVSNVSSAATLGDGSAIGTIVDDDAPTLTIADASVVEGNSGTKTLTFTVKLSKASTAAVSYAIATSNGTATAGSDYVARSLTGESIPAGTLSRTFVVTINGDTAIEANETFNVAVTGVFGAIVGDGSARGTLLNDDGALLQVNNATTTEGNSGTKSLVFTASLTQAASTPVSFTVNAAYGTATRGVDYVAPSLGTLTIPAGTLSKTFAIAINGDTTVEPNETFLVILGNATGGATLYDDQGIGTITNDD